MDKLRSASLIVIKQFIQVGIHISRTGGTLYFRKLLALKLLFQFSDTEGYFKLGIVCNCLLTVYFNIITYMIWYFTDRSTSRMRTWNIYGYFLFSDNGQFGVLLRCATKNYCSFNISSHQPLQNSLCETYLTHAPLLS